MNMMFSDSPKNILLRLSIPISLGFVMLMLIDLADAFVAVRISEEALAIQAYCYPLLYFMLALGLGINQGLTIVGSESYVEKGIQAVYENFVHSIYLALIVATILAMGVFAIIHYQWIDGNFMMYLSELSSYLRYMLFAIFPTFLVLLICSICQITGRTLVIRDTLCVMLCMTIICHPFFSLPLGLNLGLNGIAISKSIVVSIGALYASYRTVDLSLLRQLLFKFDGSCLRWVFSQAFPASIIQLLVPTYLIFVTKVIANQNAMAVAGFNLGYRIIMLIIIPMLAVLIAIIAMISQYYFSKRPDLVKEVVRITLGRGSLIILLGVLCCVGVSTLVLNFKLGDMMYVEDVANQYTFKIVKQYLYLTIFITVFEYMISVMVVCFQAIQRSTLGMFIASTKSILIPIPILWFINKLGLSIVFIWFGIALSFFLAFLVSATVFYFQFWLPNTQSNT